MDYLTQIKRLVIAHRVLFTEKAESEMTADGLTPELVYEAILNAPAIFKIVKSRNPLTEKNERLYVIKGMTFEGMDIYTKGKIITKVRSGYILCSHLLKT